MPEIVEVVAESYRAPIDPPIRNGCYTYSSSDLCLIRVRTDNGTEGLGIGDGGVGLAGGSGHDSLDRSKACDRRSSVKTR